MTDDVESRLTNLELRVTELEKRKKGGRKAKPIHVSMKGVCGIDPDRDSSICPDANVGRRQQGCQGTACVLASSEYYATYRKNKNP